MWVLFEKFTLFGTHTAPLSHHLTTLGGALLALLVLIGNTKANF